MHKSVTKYARIYRNALKISGFSDIEAQVRSYEKRLNEMLESDAFEKHNAYPTMDVYKVYAVIAMCLELKKDDLADREIMDVVNSGFKRLRNLLSIAEKIIDALPNAYQIARRWNITDHDNCVKDGSITYDSFTVTDGKIEYRISKCMYIEMFAHYGIRSLLP